MIMGIILVTGGKGFLGQHLVTRLSSLGERVRVFAHAPRSDSLPDAIGDDVVWGDVRDMRTIEQAMQGVDKVFHLVSNFRRPSSDGREAYAINVDGTLNVLQAAMRYGVQRVVHCSTVGVYGDVREIPATEKTPFNPDDPYQETKLLAEQQAREFAEKVGLPLTVVRPAPIYGPGDLRLLKLFRMVKHGWFIMLGKGDTLFHPVYIDDVIDGFVLCSTDDNAIGEAFIIANETYLPLTQLVATIAQLLQVPSPRWHLPLAPIDVLARLCERLCVPFGIEPPLHKRRVHFFKNNRAFSIVKAQRMLGFAPQVSLEDGLMRTIQWYEAHGLL